MLKNAIDYLYAEWNDKAAGFVSYGASAGGVRAVEHLRHVAGELKLADVRSQVGLSLGDDWSDFARPESFAPRELHAARLVAMLGETVAWAAALRTIRRTTPHAVGAVT